MRTPGALAAPRPATYRGRMLGLVIFLLILWAALAIFGFVVEGLLWLAVIALILFLITGIIGWLRRGVSTRT